MGEDHPVPGMEDFQSTLSVALQRTGTLVAVERPWPVGPRKEGQSPLAWRLERARRKVRDARGRDVGKACVRDDMRAVIV
jgi:hypothetical protein